MNKQPLIYSFVSKGTVVLAEHTSFTGNFSTVAIQCLHKLPPNSNKFTYSCDGHTFNFFVDKGFVFLVVADEGVGRSVPFVFLDRVKEDFMQRYGLAIGDEEGGPHPLADDADEDDDLFEDRFSIAYSLDREFGPILKEHMQYCINHPEEMSKLSKLKAQITEVKGIMMDNIEKVLDRGEKIELLVDKTETLQFQADSFQRHGRQLRRKMWLQNLRFKLIVGGSIFVIILVVWLAACKGFSCSNKS
ncbi:vesicle-associated membrane protein 727 [Carex rostrata]